MNTLVTIGEFSRLSHLTAKALRHYHDVGLLTPEQIDSSGYRRYGPGQVQQAQLVRRLRLLDMPVPDIKAVLAAPDELTRDAAIAEHLSRMEETLGRTTQVVASLRALLAPEVRPIDVQYRTVVATPALVIRAQVAKAEVDKWCAGAFPALYQALAIAGADPAGPGGATYDAAFFEQDTGEILAFVPVAQPISEPGGSDPLAEWASGNVLVESVSLPGGRFAVAVHAGSFDDIDRSYGQLGGHVAEHDEPLPLPIREQYLVGPNHSQDSHEFRTEIWWPIVPSTPSQEA